MINLHLQDKFQPLCFVRCVDTYSNLELYKYNIGDVVCTTDTNYCYVYDGNTFLEITTSTESLKENSREKYKKIYINYPTKCKFCGANLHSYKCGYCDAEYPNYKIIDVEEGKEIWNM
jgi:hypothetical protein